MQMEEEYTWRRAKLIWWPTKISDTKWFSKRSWRWNYGGVIWYEPCECDANRKCAMQRQHEAWEAAPLEPGEEFVPTWDEAVADGWYEECSCASRPPHTHTRIGFLGSRPLFPKAWEE